MNLKVGICLLLLYLCFSCIHSVHTGSRIVKINENSDIYVVDLDTSKVEDRLLASSLFKSVKVIPLETSDRALLNYIRKAEVCDDLLFVFDLTVANAIFVFDKQGRFIRNIGSKGPGPGEYSHLVNFTLDPDNKKVILWDHYKGEFLQYNFTGEYLGSFYMNGVPSPAHIQYINGSVYGDAYYWGSVPEGEPFLLQKIDTVNGKRLGVYLETIHYNKRWVNLTAMESFAFYHGSKNSYRFVQQFMDTIISIGDDGIKPFVVVKSKKFVSEEDVRLIKESKPIHGVIDVFPEMMKRDKIYNIEDYIEFSDYVIFKYMNRNTPKIVVYNKKNRSSVLYCGMKSDLLFGKNEDTLIPNYLTFDEKGVYYFVSPDRISELKHLANNQLLNPDLPNLEELKNLDEEEANPVLIYYEFKD